MLKGADLGGNAKMVKYAALMAADTRALNQVIIASLFLFYFILFLFLFLFFIFFISTVLAYRIS